MQHLEQSLRSRVPQLFEYGTEAEHLRSHIEHHWQSGGAALRYNEAAMAFNQAFFFKNILKAHVAVEQLSRSLPREFSSVVDIGAGAGSLALAWYSLGPRRAPTLLIDNSTAQLALAHRIASALGIHVFRYTNCPFHEAPPSPELGDNTLRLFSYWVCEQPPALLIDSTQWLNTFGKSAIIVDYPHTIRALAGSLASQYEVDVCSLNLSVPKSLRPLIRDASITVNALAVRRRRSFGIVDSYFRAWQTYDNQLLRSIFAPDATYVIGPRKRTLRGINEITDYWIRNAARQRDIVLSWAPFDSASESEVGAGFQANFMDIEEGKYQRIKGSMTLFLNAHRRIARLTESYSKSVSGRTTNDS